MPTIYYFDPLNGPYIVCYLSGYLGDKVEILSSWIVPGTLDLNG